MVVFKIYYDLSLALYQNTIWEKNRSEIHWFSTYKEMETDELEDMVAKESTIW